MKSTKKSLLVSVLSLMLCVAMLLGTTYAWFTDSVTSGVNTIVAGNLDVELYHKGANDEEEAKVTSETDDLFQDVAKWEPGAYAYETFTVKNVGDLALKYKMALNVASFTSYNGHNLTEVLKVAVLDNVPTSRADITGGKALKEWSLDSKDVALYPVGTQGKDSEKTFTVAIYWEPTEHDNDFNMNNGRPQPLSIEFGVNLVATQVEYESDSFNDQYDAQSQYPEMEEAKKVEKAMALATAKADEKTIFTADIVPAEGSDKKTTVEFDENALAEGEYKLEVETENNLFELKSADGTDAATIDLKLYDKDGHLTETFAEGKSAKITTYVTKGMTDVTVIYTGTNGGNPTGVDYVPATGKLEFTTNHFSEYQVNTTSAVYSQKNDTAYGTLAAAAVAAKEEDVITLLKNVDENVTVAAEKDFILNLNGCVINGKTVNSSPAILNNGTMTITDASKAGTGKIMREDKNGDAEPYYVIDNHGTMTIEKISVYNEAKNLWGGASLIRNNNIMTINSGDYKNINYAVLKNENGILTVNGGNYDSGTQLETVTAYGTVTINGGTFNKNVAQKPGATLKVYGGSFNYSYADMKSYLGDGFIEIVTAKGTTKTYQVVKAENAPKNYDAKFAFKGKNNIYYLGGVDGANAALEALYPDDLIYFNTAPTTTKGVALATYYALYSEGITPTGFVALDGYELKVEKDEQTGIISYRGEVTENSAYASITNALGTQYYCSLKSAVSDAKTGETVKILKDDSSTAACCTTSTANDITIDLNGHTTAATLAPKGAKKLTIIDSVDTGIALNYVNNYIVDSELVIKGGKFTDVIFAQNGTVTIEGGTFTGTIAEKAYSGSVYGGSGISASGGSGELVIKGGTFEKNPTAFVAEGYEAVKTGDVWTVVPAAN